jgi:hypothetical protein
MCLTCGCDDPHDNHGNPNYLTVQDLVQSASVDGLDLKTAAKRMRKALKQDRKAHPKEHGVG